MKIIGLLGAGEIGSTIKKIAEDAGYQVLVRELKYDQLKGGKVEALHVCIPYRGVDFIESVVEAVYESRPRLLLIHATTPPGVTKKIADQVGIPTAHTPVRGNHPDLYDAIKTGFVKYVGGVNSRSTKLAVAHLKKLKIEKVVAVRDSQHSEVGKMVNIISYAWSIVFCKWVYTVCKEMNLDFDTVYTDFIRTYNQGYRKTHPHVAQPILKAVPGPIGGHCVIPDTLLMELEYKSDLTKFILKKNKEYKKAEKV